MEKKNFDELVVSLKGLEVERPNKKGSGTLSGHAAGEPFEKLVYGILKEHFPKNVFKQYEFLNDMYLRHPRVMSVEDRRNLFDSPIALFLLSRGDKATKDWDPHNVFEEKQDDTADILWHDGVDFDIIDVKTRNASKKAQAPNIISAYKLAQMCAVMIDNDDFDTVDIHYIEVSWQEKGNNLMCVDSCWADLFKSDPYSLYINWAAAMQVQFHVCELDQSFPGTKKEWAHSYLDAFVASAEHRCEYMYEKYVRPFKKYI